MKKNWRYAKCYFNTVYIDHSNIGCKHFISQEETKVLPFITCLDYFVLRGESPERLRVHRGSSESTFVFLTNFEAINQFIVVIMRDQ